MKIKVLFVAADRLATTKDHLDEEIRAITEKVRASDDRDLIEIVSAWAVRPDDLLQLLNQHKPHIVHFSGHGSKDGELLLMDDSRQPELLSKAIDSDTLKALFTVLRDNIRIVVLNGCYSASQAAAISDVIDCVVGINTYASDKERIVFASSFYRALGFERSVKEAFEQGKLALLLEIGNRTNVYQLSELEKIDPQLLSQKNIDTSKIFLLKSIVDFALIIDDVIIIKGKDDVCLDIRLRNPSLTTVNITRANLHILSRKPYKARVETSAVYDLLVDGENNVISVAHVLKSNEVDRFNIRLGFTEKNVFCRFEAELILTYNKDFVSISKIFTFDSIFEEKLKRGTGSRG